MTPELNIAALRGYLLCCWPTLNRPWTHDDVHATDEDGREAVCQMMNSARALLAAAEERDALRAECDRLREALREVTGYLDAYVPGKNCSCFILPPCSDCLLHSDEREAISTARALLSPAPEGGAK